MCWLNFRIIYSYVQGKVISFWMSGRKSNRQGVLSSSCKKYILPHWWNLGWTPKLWIHSRSGSILKCNLPHTLSPFISWRFHYYYNYQNFLNSVKFTRKNTSIFPGNHQAYAWWEVIRIYSFILNEKGQLFLGKR